MTSSPSFSEQVSRLIDLGYPAMLGLGGDEFGSALRPLGAIANRSSREGPADTLDCLLVISTPRLPVADLLPKVVRSGRTAVERLFPKKPSDFVPTSDFPLPEGDAYLLFGVDRGDATLNKTPLESMPLLAAAKRSPLTIEEGVAVLTQEPEFLQPNHCFMLLGSRCDDKRVPALWLSDGRPKLGWCWEGNRHTWLGMASCLGRSEAVPLGGDRSAPQRLGAEVSDHPAGAG